AIPDTAPTALHTLSLHDALPISRCPRPVNPLDCLQAVRLMPKLTLNQPAQPVQPHHCSPPTAPAAMAARPPAALGLHWRATSARSEEHTSELQSRENLVCRLLRE